MNSLMKLKVYSESDSEEEQCFEKRLPLPDFLDNSSEKKLSREVDEEGRVRNFPHEPGNWATYLFIPVDSTEYLDYATSLLQFFKPLDLKINDDFHISLTKTVILRHHWIPDFINSIKNKLAQINSFRICLFGLKAYTNEQKTRSFLSLKVNEGEDNLISIVHCLMDCFKDYKICDFYEEPSFHISLCWCPGDRLNEINNFIETLPVKLKNVEFYEEISHSVCTTGNKKFTFNFNEIY